MIKKTILLIGLSDTSAQKISRLLRRQNRYDLLSIPFAEDSISKIFDHETTAHSLKCVVIDLDDIQKSDLKILDRLSKEKKLTQHTLIVALHSLSSGANLRNILSEVTSHLIYGLKKPVSEKKFEEILHKLRHNRIYHLITDTAKKYL